jgi:tRNA(adenine34) deaminase
MQKALELARRAEEQGEVPVGALVVRDNQVISEAYNLREKNKKSTAHAELLAIEAACEKLGAWRLQNCCLYVTLEPCLMCAGAIVQSRLPQVVFGARDPKGGAVVSLYESLTDSRLNHRVQVRSGLLEEECSVILSRFFKARRG